MGEVVDLQHARDIRDLKESLGGMFGDRTYLASLSGVGLALVEGQPRIFFGVKSGDDHHAVALSLEDAEELRSSIGAMLAGLSPGVPEPV